MSLERRQYNERAGVSRVENVEEQPKVVDWDERASQRAIATAQRIAGRDPSASQYLAAQAMAQTNPPSPYNYDPARMYAEMLLYVQLKPSEINQMHFMHFFGLRREIILAREREREHAQREQDEYDT